MITTDNANDFKAELKALLKKYNANIWVSLDGDTHGVSCEIMVDVDNKTIMTTDGSINQYDIKIKK